MANDPYEIDVDELNKLEGENKGGSTGKICPKRNVSIGKTCGACDYIVAHIYPNNYPDNHPAAIYARQKKAKSSMFLNVVFEDDPNTSMTLEIGSEVGQSIIWNIKNKKGWNVVANPKKGKGRLMTITKKPREGSKFPKYEADIDPDMADWEIPKKVIDNLPNLDQENLIKMVTSGDFDDSNYMHIRTLKMGESLTFRLCPPWTTGEKGKENKRPFEFLWRHWGVSDAQISGEEKMDWRSQEEDNEEAAPKQETPPWEEPEKQEAPKEEPVEKAKPVKKTKAKKEEPKCFGDDEWFDKDEVSCQECEWFKKCGRKVMSG